MSFGRKLSELGATVAASSAAVLEDEVGRASVIGAEIWAMGLGFGFLGWNLDSSLKDVM